MAFTLSQPLYGQGGSYTAQQDRLLINADVSSPGVKKLTAASGGVMTGDLAVTTTGTGNGSVSVASGDVFVKHTTSGQGMYYAFNDAATTVGSFAANSSGNPRIDLVCVLVTDTGATPSVAFSIVQGTPAASPVAPTPPASSTAHYLTLAQVTIPNGFTVTTTVAAGNIVDVRTKALIPDLSVQGTVSSTGTLATNVPSPSDGQLLYSSSGKHLIAYNAARSAFEQVAPTAGFRNGVINGGFDVWQRGTSIGTTGGPYTADRWQASGSNNYTVQRFSTADTTNLPFIQYCARVQRNAASTDVGTLYFAQSFETPNSYPFVGQQVTFSFWARCGTNYSPTGSALSVQVGSGTGTDQNIISGYTGFATPVNTSVTLTTTWQRFQFTATVASSATQVGVRFYSTGVGTAGANDYYELTGVQLELGAVASPFERRPIGTELALCQRYWEKSYTYADPAGTGTFVGLMTLPYSQASPTTGELGGTMRYAVAKRNIPAITIYDHSGNINKCTRLQVGVANLANQVVTAGSIGTNNFNISSASCATSTAAIQFFFVADSEL